MNLPTGRAGADEKEAAELVLLSSFIPRIP